MLLTNLASGISVEIRERLWDSPMNDTDDLKSDWLALLEWAEQEIGFASTQEEVFEVFSVLNRTIDRFVHDFNGSAPDYTIPEELQKQAEIRLWQIRHPITMAIAMGETYSYRVDGVIHIKLKKEVNVKA